MMLGTLMLAGSEGASLVELVHRTPTAILATLDLCLAIAFLALWWSARDFPVFRAAGLLLCLVSVEQIAEYSLGMEATWALRCLPVGFVLETAGEALQLKYRRWIRLFWVVVLIAITVGWWPSMAVVRDWPILFSQPVLAVLIFIGFRRPSLRDRTIAAAFAGLFLVRMTLAPSVRRMTGLPNFLRVGGWDWQFTGSAITLLGGVTLAVFVRELIRDRRERQRLLTEVEAARAIQQMIMPEERYTVVGFEVRSVYQPFGELGGDFFQLVPLPDGGMLIAIGDVSGKGVSAAMLVSLLVGSLHTLAERQRSPADLLAGLNRRVLGRSCGGFTTCLVLRVDVDGRCTIANAGHLAPYCDGVELECMNGLPLGLVAEVEYVETVVQLGAGGQITLLTDGVVEARNVGGELFGFARTESISAQSAAVIAQAATEFGQDDDITVLTLVRD
jgi:hypothetical protein